MRQAKRTSRFVVLLGGALLLGACSPALDWREARPKGTDLLLTFPCKPQQLTQPVMLGEQRVTMSMTGCVASGMTFALAHADVGSAARVAPALATLRDAALANVHGQATAVHASAVDHATPGLADAVEMDVAGRDPRGGAVREHIVLFAQGSQVYQATALAASAHYQDDAARSFTTSIRLPER
ncbi:hypothetical protein GALL_287080 [mine drainage metagenome]|uniref:Lipoprotein n=1 Tax=mine drainage metagenome TaxID=410659 RepID=A0A1J5R1P8_9ZZZZ